MDFESKKVDEIVVAASAMLKVDASSDRTTALEMERALSARANRQDAVTNRFVVEAADEYISDLDDRSRSGSAEWDALSKAVDAARKPVLAADDRNREAHMAAARAAAMGMGR